MAWKNLEKSVIVPNRCAAPHKVGNQNSASRATQDVIDYLYQLGKEEGETYATRFIRFLTGWSIRDNDRGNIQLPSSFTKRQIYAKYCYNSGWIAKCDYKGNYSSLGNYRMRENDEYNGEMASWPFGMVRKEICAFGTFCKIWNDYLPFISIRPPSLDTCL